MFPLMTKLEAVLERVSKLPQEEQEALAHEIEFMLDHPPEITGLSPEVVAELRRRASAPDDLATDAEVEAFFSRLAT